MTLIAKNINNINQNFETKLVQIGVPNVCLRKKFGETAHPNVESVNCVGTGDEQSCNVNYKKSDPVWAYFNITPPSTDAPEAPTLVQPVPPTGQSSCEVGVGYDAVACAAYQTAYTQYQKDQQTYDQAQAQYKKDLDAWSSSDETAYQQLDEAIQAYNLKFDNTEIKAWTQYEVKETKFESQVVTSAPAEIIAGGDLNIYADAFKNDKSYVLAGGKLNAELCNRLTYTYSNWRGGFKRYHERKWNKSQTYNPADEIKEIDLPVNQWLGNVKNHTSNQNISAVSTGNHATITTDTVNTPEQLVDRQQQSQQVDINVNAGQSVTANGQETNTPNTPDQLDVNSGEKRRSSQAAISISGSAAKITNKCSANNRGQRVKVILKIRSGTNTESQSKYLVETDPAFINYKQWLSSDYMLDAMDIDPALKQKRLGDGYYEQRLVQDQIAQLTGFRFLQGYANDEAQYKALMNNGLTFAKNYNLRPGIALTAAQIAQLTTDIVWLEEKTIKLADGTTTKALVPQVYVKARASDLKGDGTLVSANQVRLNVQGDVLNSATIADVKHYKSQQIASINSVGGCRRTDVELNTTKDLNNIGMDD
ncbi:hypothetical protein FQR65_LT17791 [Abscondita terminalis]|nr:hypothetical protein FQR65_LT17791 [Abscondita terminalis]